MLVFAKAIVFKNIKYNMREWLSGGAPPCQGGGRGFDPRLALLITGYPKGYPYFIYSKFKITKKELLIYERKRIIWFEIRIHFSVGRASRKGIGKAFDVLEKKSGIGEAVFAAMTHAFFTLSIGMGAILIEWMCLAVLFVTAIYLIAFLTGRKKSI